VSIESAPNWGAALNTYTLNPYQNRLAMLALRRHVTADVPALYVLAIADAQLRARQFDAARRRFSEALARGLDEPWASWAIAGRAWAELAAEDFDAARSDFDRVSEAQGKVAALGDFAVGFLDAADDRPGAAERFARVVENEAADDAMRRAARLGVAYTRYWSGDYHGAAEAFEVLANEAEIGTLRDDAAYGAAWSRQHAGEAGARAALEGLAGRGYRGGPASRALVNLEPQALLQAGLLRYRKAPLRPPEEQLGTLLDGDGVVLARAALRWARAEEARDGTIAPRAPLAGWRARTATDDLAARKVGMTYGAGGTPGEHRHGGTPAAGAPAPQASIPPPVRLAVAIAVAVAAVLWGFGRAARPRIDLRRHR
jgi:hypothetical protein